MQTAIEQSKATKAAEDRKANQMWSFEDGADGSGNWKKFDSETAARLERAYMANAGPFTTTVGTHGEYTFDVRAMRQQNTRTGNTRRIVRGSGSGGAHRM